MKKKIKYGKVDLLDHEFDPKKGKILINIWLRLDVFDALKNNHKNYKDFITKTIELAALRKIFSLGDVPVRKVKTPGKLHNSEKSLKKVLKFLKAEKRRK